MQLDDLLGLLFLFFFVILPALRGLLRRGENTFDIPDLDELPTEPDQSRPRPPAPAQPRPTQSTAQPQPARPPAPSSPPPKAQPRPVQPQPRPPQPRPQRKSVHEEHVRAEEEQVRRKLSELERRLSQAQPEALPKAARPSPQEPAQQPRALKKLPAFGTDSQAILNGIVWSEILKESKGRAYLNKRNPRLAARGLVKER